MSEKKQKVQKQKKSQNTKAEKKQSKLGYIVLCIAIIAFSAYAAVTLINLHYRIAGKQAELEQIKSEVSVQELKNSEMKKLYDYSDEEFSSYVEQIARDDLDFVGSGERVFVNVSGD